MKREGPAGTAAAGPARFAFVLPLLIPCLVGLVSIPRASARSVDAVEAANQLTKKTIAVRAGIEGCTTRKDLPFMTAGQTLERSYENTLNEVAATALKKTSWRRFVKKNCVIDCTCFAISRIREKFAKQTGVIPHLEARLAKMTDADYIRCKKAASGLCQSPEVQKLLADLEESAN